MYLLKSFSGLVMSTDVKDGFVSITGSLVIVQFLSLKINNFYGVARVFDLLKLFPRCTVFLCFNVDQPNSL